MINKIADYYRIGEWYSSKIPLSMAIFFYVVEYSNIKLENTVFLKNTVFFFLFWVCFFAFNYLYNDYTDIENDRKAGKIKTIQSIASKITLLNLIILFVISMILCFVCFPDNLYVALTAFVSYLLGIAYSARGIRFKEKGIYGVIECSFAQRNMPIIMLFVMMPVAPLTFICWMCIVFINGLRYILIHQLLDKENDKKVGIETFVTQSKMPVKSMIIVFCLSELCFLAVLFHKNIFTFSGFIFIVVYAVLCLLNHIFVKKVLNQSYMFSFANMPLEDLYNVFLPILLAFVYGLNNQCYWLIIATLIYLCIPLLKKIAMPMMCLWKIVTGNIKLSR